MNRVLIITLGSLLLGFAILFFNLFTADAENSLNIANIVLSIIPSWAAFGSLILLLVTFVFLSIVSLFKKQNLPAFINSVFSETVRIKIASYEKPLFLLSQIFFCLWSYYALAHLFAGI